MTICINILTYEHTHILFQNVVLGIAGKLLFFFKDFLLQDPIIWRKIPDHVATLNQFLQCSICFVLSVRTFLHNYLVHFKLQCYRLIFQFIFHSEMI